MDNQPLRIETAPNPADLAFLDERINEFNIASTGIPFEGEFASFVRDTRGTIIAGIAGWTWGGCCYIHTLWVLESLRGQGHGARLLQAAEHEAIARDCHLITLETHSFQAPGFYTKFGYTLVGRVDGYPRGHTKLWLQKLLGSAVNA